LEGILINLNPPIRRKSKKKMIELFEMRPGGNKGYRPFFAKGGGRILGDYHKEAAKCYSKWGKDRLLEGFCTKVGKRRRNYTLNGIGDKGTCYVKKW